MNGCRQERDNGFGKQSVGVFELMIKNIVGCRHGLCELHITLAVNVIFVGCCECAYARATPGVYICVYLCLCVCVCVGKLISDCKMVCSSLRLKRIFSFSLTKF